MIVSCFSACVWANPAFDFAVSRHVWWFFFLLLHAEFSNYPITSVQIKEE